MLIKEGADINITDFRGYNVLHHAVQYGRIYPAFYALNKGIDVNSRGKIPPFYYNKSITYITQLCITLLFNLFSF